MKQKYRLINITDKRILLEELWIADTFSSRFKGLMGKEVKESEGMWIKPCNSIHCFFMKVSIDVLFLNDHDEVIYKIDAMKPWRISPIIRKAASVVEGPAEAFYQVNIGDRLGSIE